MNIFTRYFSSFNSASVINFFRSLPKSQIAVAGVALAVFSLGIYYIYSYLKGRIIKFDQIQIPERVSSSMNTVRNCTQDFFNRLRTGNISGANTSSQPSPLIAKLKAQIALLQTFYTYVQEQHLDCELAQKKSFLEQSQTCLNATPSENSLSDQIAKTSELISEFLKWFNEIPDHYVSKVLNHIDFDKLDPSILTGIKETLKPHLSEKTGQLMLCLTLDGSWEQPKFITQLIIEHLANLNKTSNGGINGTYSLDLSFSNTHQTGHFALLKEALQHFKCLNNLHLDFSRGINDPSLLEIKDLLDPLTALPQLTSLSIHLPSATHMNQLNAIASMIKNRDTTAGHLNVTLTFDNLDQAMCESFMQTLAADAKTHVTITFRRWNNKQALEDETQESINKIIKDNHFIHVEYLAVV